MPGFLIEKSNYFESGSYVFVFMACCTSTVDGQGRHRPILRVLSFARILPVLVPWVGGCSPSDSHRDDGAGRNGMHGRRRGRSDGGGPEEALAHAVRPQVNIMF